MDEPRGSSAEYGVALARGLGGALLFAFPLLMTMEMWWLGFHVDRLKLLIFLLVNFAMVLGLGWFVGFERRSRPRDLFLEAFAAYGIGIVASAAMLAVFGIIKSGMGASEIVGKVAIQAIPASLGATLARKQLASGDPEEEKREDEREERAGYPGQLFLMAAGAIYVSFNVAPTEEMLLIAFKMTPVRTAALVLLSLAVLHGFVYTVGFKGQEPQAEMSFARVFVAYTLAGFAVALCVSVYVLWTFDRLDGVSPTEMAGMVAVMGFPAALGAAVARLVV
jgi:putative integral membrane protein (TIGR02587 family)